MAKHRPRYLQSVNHALRALRLFSPERPHWTVTQVAKDLDLGKSTASRLLSTMAAQGFVSKDLQTGRYGLGLRAYEVGLAYLSGLSLRRVAMPILEELAFTVHETVYLGILGDRVGIYIEKILSPLALRVDSHIGLALPLHATALGKALLASQSDRDVNAVVAAGLRAYTRRTLTSAHALRAELRLVRRQGFALDIEEFEENLHCIGLPLRDHRGIVVAAFSVSGPAVRFTRQTMERHIPHLRQAAAAISTQLGFMEPADAGKPAASKPGRSPVLRSRTLTPDKGG
jgi:DNA-binding IclR family transcriptional regulator